MFPHFVALAHCIFCYECESKDVTSCVDPFILSTQPVNYCAQYNLTACRKAHYKGFGIYQKKSKRQTFFRITGNIYRSCYPGDPNKISSCLRLYDKRAGAYVQAESCHVCYDDFCNSATNNMLSMLVIVTTTFLASVLSFFFARLRF